MVVYLLCDYPKFILSNAVRAFMGGPNPEGSIMKNQPAVKFRGSNGGRWKVLKVNGRPVYVLSAAIGVVRALGWYVQLKLETDEGIAHWDSF